MSDGNLLSGIRVVEYSRDVPAAACGLEFARWGARVSAFEAHDSQLLTAPPTVARHGDQVSLLRESLMVGKTLESGDWRTRLPEADVFVTDAPLAELSGISEEFPELVVVHSSPFGTDGPYAEYLSDDLIIQALSGFAGTNGVAPQEPLAAPAAIIPRAIGILGAVAALAALLERIHSGRGEWIELSFARGLFDPDHVAALGVPGRGAAAGRRDAGLGGSDADGRRVHHPLALVQGNAAQRASRVWL